MPSSCGHGQRRNMSSFTTPLVVSPLPDGRRWRLVFQFCYDVGWKWSGERITVPLGFLTDFASIPRFLFFLPAWAKYCKSSIIHDWLYKTGKIMGEPITRKRADEIFYEALLIEWRDHKAGRFWAWVEYKCVRGFGWLSWDYRPWD